MDNKPKFSKDLSKVVLNNCLSAMDIIKIKFPNYGFDNLHISSCIP
ncbi:hypothetical protein J4474_02560 [Candidatus Pacearchaeota archaeon]|nr:hypothetical protein [Candidatus Pacearchaeota archaeon]